MTITDVRLAKVSFTSLPQSQGRAEVHWFLDSDDPAISEETALEEAQNDDTSFPSGLTLPEAGDTYDINGDRVNNLFLTSLTIEKHGQREKDRKKTLLLVQGQYETVSSGINPSSVPIDQPMLPFIEFETRSMAIDFATLKTSLIEPSPMQGQNGKVTNIVNSVGDPFDTPLYRDQTIVILNQRRYVDDLDDVLAINKKYANTTNSKTFKTFGPEQAFFIGCTTGLPEFIGKPPKFHYLATLRIGFMTGFWPRTSATATPEPMTTRIRLRNAGFNCMMVDPEGAGDLKVACKPKGTDNHFADQTKVGFNADGTPRFPDTERWKPNSSEPIALTLGGLRVDDPIWQTPPAFSFLEYQPLDEVDYNNPDLNWFPTTPDPT